MLNTLAVLEVVLALSCTFAITRWWLAISNDVHAGRLARLVCIVALGVIILPVAKVVLPSVELPLLPEGLWQLFQWRITESQQLFIVVTLVFYGLGVFFHLLSVFYSHLSLHASITDAQSAEPKILQALISIAKAHGINGRAKPIQVVIADVKGPFTTGAVTPKIVLPESAQEWSDDRMVRVLTHELAHIARRDWLWTAIVDVLLCLAWFMPTIRTLKKRFSWLSELNADDAVLLHDDNRTAYASDMLDIAQSSLAVKVHQSSAAVALIDGSYCYERIAAILDGSRLRGSKPFVDRSLMTAVVAGFFWCFVAMVGFGAVPSQSIALAEFPRGTSPLQVVQSIPESTDHELIFCGIQPTSSNSSLQRNVPPEISEVVIRFDANESFNRSLLEQELHDQVMASAEATFDDIQINPYVQVQGYVAIRSVIPQYPRKAQRKKIEGQVIAQFSVMPDGSASDVRIAMATPSDIFNKTVISAIEKSYFKPATHNGVAIKTEHATQTFTFKLTEGATQKTYQSTLGIPIKTATYAE